MSLYVEQWLIAFLWTLAVELPIYAGFLRRYFATWWAPCLLALGVNVTTHPTLWFVAVDLRPWFPDYATWVAAMEVCVWLVESAICALILSQQTGPRRAIIMGYVTALAANVVSTFVGFVVFWDDFAVVVGAVGLAGALLVEALVRVLLRARRRRSVARSSAPGVESPGSGIDA